MICIQCNDVVDATPCPSCGSDPLLLSRYRMDARIGQGAAGTVFRATDMQSGKVLAIKEMPFRASLDRKQQELLERESRVLRQLSHPAIPSWVGQHVAGQGRGRSLYLLQEFIEGESLKEEMTSRRYTEDEVLGILDEVLGILGYLHRLAPPVIHRDLKPANLMRRPDGSLALIDFGAVRDVIRNAQTGGSTVAGTFGYMAPEQFAGDAAPATDIFALGATAITLLSRQDPASLHQRSGHFQWADVVSASPAVRSLLAEMVANDPTQRPDDARALQARIRRIRAGEVPAPPPAPNAAPWQRPTPVRQPDPQRAAFEQLNAPNQALIRAESAAVAVPKKTSATLPLAMVTMGSMMAMVLIFAMVVGFFLVRVSPAPPPPMPVEQVQPVMTEYRITTDQYTAIDPVAAEFPEGMELTEDVTCTMDVSISPDGSVIDSAPAMGNQCAAPFVQTSQEALAKWRFDLNDGIDPAGVYITTIKMTFTNKSLTPPALE